eukprot:Nk52_evm95s151 gene=Nk52_evmTU95s151
MVTPNNLRLGDMCPNFTADTTKGRIDFHEWMGDQWAILCSHPADFTPVCTTELGYLAKLMPELAARNVKPIALSCDSVDSHNRWSVDICETQGCTAVDYPIIGDEDRKVATLYGMLDQDPENVDKAGMPMTVRSVFIIDSNKKIRLIITYPASTGRNFDEVLRCIDSLQLTDTRKVATPVNWNKGDKVVVVPTIKTVDAQKMFSSVEEVKPYLRMTTL